MVLSGKARIGKRAADEEGQETVNYSISNYLIANTNE